MPKFDVVAVIQSAGNTPVTMNYGKNLGELEMIHAVAAALVARRETVIDPVTLSVIITPVAEVENTNNAFDME